MDSQGRKVIVCDNGTGVSTRFYCQLKESVQCVLLNVIRKLWMIVIYSLEKERIKFFYLGVGLQQRIFNSEFVSDCN